MSDRIGPALDAWWWRNRSVHLPHPYYLGQDDRGRFYISTGEYGYDKELDVSTLHGIAALCLHETPYGFTWEDVDALMDAAVRDEEVVGMMGGRDYRSKWRGLAERVEALLPPRETNEQL